MLFADVAGSTRLTERMDAEAALAILGPAIAAMTDAIERFGGTVAKRMGDGVMALFGVPRMLEDHAARACHAALALQHDIQRHAADVERLYGADLRVRIGINSGSVVVTSGGDARNPDYDVTGPTVHLAQRVEAAAAPGSACLAEGTYRLVRRTFECQPLGVRTMKGFTEPQAIYRLLQAKKLASEHAPDTHLAQTPLVGREQELAAVSNRLGALAAGEGSVILVTGEAGVGKTRLLAETRARFAKDIQWMEGHALSSGQRLSYWPFVEALKAQFKLADAHEQNVNWTILESGIGDLFGDERAEIVPYIATILALDVPAQYEHRVRHLDGEALGRQIALATRRLFERLARQRPLALVIEDLHWVDGSSAALLEHLLSLALEVPILFYVLGRPDESATRFAEVARESVGQRACEVNLRPLSVADSARLIISLLGNDAQTARIRDLILYKAEGNPFFMEEVVRTLLDLKILERDASRAGWTVREGAIAIPDTIQGVIMARVDRLDERLKNVLGVASVIGRTFFYRVLRAVSEKEAELEGELGALRAVDIIDEMKSAPELAYLFRHALAHEAVYQSLLIENRKRLHDRIAGCLHSLYADRPGEVASLLAYHYARAGNWKQALHHLLEAADQSARMAADHEALLHYEEALQAYRASGTDWNKAQQATIQRRLGEIHMRRGDPERSLKYFSVALQVFGDSFPESRRNLLRNFLEQLVVQLAHRALPALFSAAQTEKIDGAEEAHLRVYESLCWALVSFDQERFMFAVVKILNMSERLGLVEANAKASAAFGFALDLLGLRRLALHYHGRATALADSFGNPATVGVVYVTLGDHYFFEGELSRALEHHRRSQASAWSAGDLITWTSVTMIICETLTEQSLFEASLLESRRMIDTGRDAAFQPALRWGLAARGKTLRRMGRLDEAVAELEASLGTSLSARDFLNLCFVYSELALCRLELGATEQALAAATEGRRIAQDEHVRMHPAVSTLLALAAAQLKRYEADPLAAATMLAAARRSCRLAVAASRRFAVMRAPALRLAGVAAWHAKRRRKAVRLWERSAESAQALGARYELALLLIERGRLMGREDDRRQGSKLLAELRAATPGAAEKS